jgi:polar amino acid transport system substrate-binding protein
MRIVRVVGSVVLSITLVAILLAVTPVPSQSTSMAKGPTLEAIRARGVLRVGMSATYEPWEFNKNGQIVGIDADIIARISKDLGVKPDMIDTNWAGVIASLYANKFDTIISALTVTPERASKIFFTQPYGSLAWVFLVKKSKGYKTAADLEGKTIALEGGGASQTTIENYQKAGHKYKNVLYLSNNGEAYLATQVGRSDATLDGMPGVLYFIKTHPDYTYIPAYGPDTWTAIGVRFDNPDLCTFLNDEITQMKKDGTMAQILTKWLGANMVTPAQPKEYKVCEK